MLRLLFDQKSLKDWIVDGLTIGKWSPLRLKDLPPEEVVLRAGVLAVAKVWHLDLFDPEALAAGTGHHLKDRYPQAILQIADALLMRRGVKSA